METDVGQSKDSPQSQTSSSAVPKAERQLIEGAENAILH